MDDKKQNLTPELKQIYERVMNTKAQPAAPTNEAQTPAASTPAPASAQTPTPPASPQMPVSSPPAAPEQAPVTPNQTPQATQPPIQAASPNSQQANSTFLSSLPPRPINTSGNAPFTFSSKNGNTPDKSTLSPAANPTSPQTVTHAGKTGSKKMSSKIIMLLVGALVIVWSVFWAKFFKFF